jgi:hypothetical protein
MNPSRVHRRSAVFSNGSTLLLIRSGGTAVPGVHPVWRVPQVSFLTILSICGAEGWVFNRDSGLSAGVLLNYFNHSIELSGTGESESRHSLSMIPSDSEDHVG